MHLNKVILNSHKYPTSEYYPFTLDILHNTKHIDFDETVTLFIGENGTGKSTLLKAICRKCGIHIWEGIERTRYEVNPYEEDLYRYINIEWADGSVPGSFFASQIFHNFAQFVDERAAATPDVLKYYGGSSLMTKSHGQSILAYFKARYMVKGLYFMDEPETALSPQSQLELLRLLRDMSKDGHAQFIIATHSPILMACPCARIYNFDDIPVKTIDYESTGQYRIYRDFMNNRDKFLNEL